MFSSMLKLICHQKLTLSLVHPICPWLCMCMPSSRTCCTPTHAHTFVQGSTSPHMPTFSYVHTCMALVTLSLVLPPLSLPPNFWVFQTSKPRTHQSPTLSIYSKV